MSAVTVYTASSEIRFGKYKALPGKPNKTVQQLMESDPKYLIWCHENIDWFALEEQLYKDACDLMDQLPDYAKLKKAATPSDEQPVKSPNADMFDSHDEDDGIPF